MKHPLAILSFMIGLLAATGNVLAADLPAAGKPHIVVFLSDDHSRSDSSVFGAADIRTPGMERLARDGMTFDRAFVASPSCAPSRGALLSGLMPARNGAEANHAKPRPGVKLLPAYLRELGYETVAFGKVGHYKFTEEAGFDLARHTGFHDDEAIPAALRWLRARAGVRPLALFVGSNWPHVPWPETRPPHGRDTVTLPPTLVNAPETREARARYLTAVSRMDAELTQVYDLARATLGTNLLFLHTSDHGAQFPFSKWSCYDEGIRTPMFFVWPGVVRPGAHTAALVSWVDILPTLIEAAGGQAPAALDGRSLLPVLRGEKTAHRDRIFVTHSGDGDINVYPMRAVRDERWKLILNLHPEYEFHTHIDLRRGGKEYDYWTAWEREAQTDVEAAAKVQRYFRRPAEELYDLAADPGETNNLAADPAQADRRAALRAQLEDWMRDQGDTRRTFGQPRLLPSAEAPAP